MTMLRLPDRLLVVESPGLWGVVLLAVGLVLLAGCSPGQPVGNPVSRVPILSTETPTLLPTATPTPLPTSTPTPTPTPVAAIQAGMLPGGQVVFSSQRAGESLQELWLVDAVDGLRLAQPAVAPGLWQCAGGDPTRCVFATTGAALQVSLPASGTLILLDDLSVSAALSGTSSLAPAVPVSATAAFSSSLALTRTVVPDSTGVVSRTLPSVQLALAPDGSVLAVAAAGGVKVFDLATQSLRALAQITGTTEMVWSPDSSLLALAFPAADGANTVGLWNWREGTMRALAFMQDAGHLAWAPDGAKLAFDGRQTPLTPASQGGQSDVFIAFLKSGEIVNLTEVFVRNNGLAPGQQIAAWAPRWDADSATVRYVLGVPGQPDQQSIARHPLNSRRFKGIEPVAETGAAGIVRSPNGKTEARVAAREDRQIVQVRSVDGEWRDASPGTFEGVHRLVWAPSALQPEDPDAASGRYLLLISQQALYVLDVGSGQIGGLAVACPTCTIDRAAWLP